MLELSRIGHAIAYLLALALMCMPIVWVAEGVTWLGARSNPAWGFVGSGVAVLLLLMWSSAMTDEKELRKLEVHRYWAPTILSVAIAFFATFVFGAVTHMLQRIGVVEIEPVAPLDRGPLRYADSYLWHLAEAIPALDITDTLNWKNKYTHHDPVSGWLILSFKVFVLVVVIGSFVRVRQLRRKHQSADGQPEEAAAGESLA